MHPKVQDWIARWLPRNARRLGRLRLGWAERRLRKSYHAQLSPFVTQVHGFKAMLNGGNPYPFIIAEHPVFNRPLTELVRQIGSAAGRPIVVVDVGASLGNTVLLLQQQTPGAIARIHCVEADDEFFALLQHNTAQFPNVILHQAMLARESKQVASLVHHHRGSATATGSGSVSATALDSILLTREPHFDVLKIDVDGSDGEVLTGAEKLLQRDHPAVIFEWHPALIHQAGHDPRAAFTILGATGYRRFLWFRNTGQFSHFGSDTDPAIALWEKFLLLTRQHGDPHFDIIALPPQLESFAFSLAAFGRLS
jgi:FkbM family methyltransferase